MSAERAAWESAPHGPSPQSGGLSSSWRERPCKDRPPGPLVGVDPGSLGVPSHPSSKGPVPCGWLVAQAGRAPWPEAPEPRGAPCPHTDMVGLGLLVAARPRLPAWHHVTRCAAPRGQTRPVLACQSLLGRDTNVPGRRHVQQDCLPSWLTVWGPRRPLSSAVPPGTPSALAGLRRSPAQAPRLAHTPSASSSCLILVARARSFSTPELASPFCPHLPKAGTVPRVCVALSCSSRRPVPGRACPGVAFVRLQERMSVGAPCHRSKKMGHFRQDTQWAGRAGRSSVLQILGSRDS